MRRVWFLLILIALPNFAQSVVRLENLQIKSKSEASYFIFNLNKTTYGRVKLFPKNKLLVEFANTRLHVNLPKQALNDRNVQALSVKKINDKQLQFWIQLKHPAKWDVSFVSNKAKSGVELKLSILTPKAKKKITLQNKIDSELNQLKPLPKIPPLPLPIPEKNTSKPERFTVVIDAGHGGKDSGALGKRGTQEKAVVLAISKLLAERINQTEHMRAILTRNGDYYIPLRQRLRLARRGDADIFIAIHADAYFENNATGASVYALSKHGATTEAARWLAQSNNYTELGDVQFDRLQDNSVILRSVLIDLAQTTTIRDSLLLGSKVLESLDDMSPLHFKRVQQAPFVVLKSPDIPSILIETGFITNRREEKRLRTQAYQRQLAEAIYKGIHHYYRAYGRHY